MKNMLARGAYACIGGILITNVSAAVLPNTTAHGVVYLTYDRAAWATLAPSAVYFDIHGNPTGITNSCADVNGQRWMFPDRFEGTNWVEAAYPADYLTPLPDYPLTQPAGGFVLPVNSYGSNSFATNHTVTTYNSISDTNGYIGLGGSFRATSDFNEPGASVWWEHLALRQDPGDSIWKLDATSGPGKGSLFELRNVTTETINGNLHLSGDYVFGATDWSQFFQNANGHLDTNMVLGHIELIPEGVEKLFAGKAVINYNQSAWESLGSGFAPPPVMTLSAFFNQAQANALSQSNLLHDAQSGYSYSNQVYGMNTATVSNLPTRYAQPTTFLYPRGHLTNHLGSIGLGGVARFAVLGGVGGNLLFGDYTLQYDTNRIALGGTGWYLLGNIPPAAAAFDLLSVKVTESTNWFSISGNLGVSFEVANLLFNTPSDALANVGTFNFTGYTVPLSIPVLSPITLFGGHLAMQATNGLPGTSFTLLSAANVALPLSQWGAALTGVFDDNGTSSNSLSIPFADPARFFRIQQP